MTAPVINRTPLNLAAINCLCVQYMSSRYERSQNTTILTTSAISLAFRLTSLAAGGVRLPFGYPKYGLLVNGIERATYMRIGTELQGTFVGSLVDEPDDWVLTQIVAYDASGARVANPVECLLAHWIGIDRNGTLKNCPDAIFQTGSFFWTHVASVYAWARVPKPMLGNSVQPLPSRIPVPFATALPLSQIARVDRLPVQTGETYYPCVTTSGVTVTGDMQAYFQADMVAAYPELPLLDGPRGVATASMVTFLKYGRNRKLYGCDPFSLWVIDEFGTKRTLAGLGHMQAPLWSEAKADGPWHRTFGNWDASIPVLQRFLWECWGFDWDLRTLALDMTAAPIGGEQPHIPTGPALFASDRHGYVDKLQFDGSDHLAPAIITRFFAANDPWGLACVDGIIYVAERGLHRISKWDATTAAYLGDEIANPTGGSLCSLIPSTHAYQRNAGVTQAQMEATEGAAYEVLAIQDGLLYYGSVVMQEVRRKNLATGVKEVVCRPQFGGNSHFLYLALSDGTFGPRGTVFTTTFENAKFGRAEAWLPTPGIASDGTPLTNSVSWNWQDYAPGIQRGTGATEAAEYAIAVAIKDGRLAQGNSNMGIQEFMQADAADPVPDHVRAKSGQAYFNAQCYPLLFGTCGFGPTLYPPPLGEYADMDYFLTLSGAAPVSAPAPTPIPTPAPAPAPTPAPAPIQTTGTTVFKSVSKTASSSYPPLPATGQRMEFHLHGSGGGFDPSTGNSLYTAGDTYVGIGDTTLGVVDNNAHEWHVQSGGSYGSTQIPPNPPPFVQVNPVDKVTPPAYPHGIETNWSGDINAGVFSPYTERCLDVLYDWACANLVGPDGALIDPKRAVVTGNSMGAWGGVAYGLRRPDKFAAVTVTQPRFRASSVPVWNAVDESPPAGLKIDDGSDFAATYDSIAYIADRTHRLPLLVWTVATSDPFTAFADHQAAIAAFRARIRDVTTTNAQRTGFACGWVPGVHGAAGPGTAVANALIWSAQSMGACYDPTGWRTDIGYPVFDNSSLDADPLTAASGFINNGFKWRNVVESAGAWACEVSNSAAVTVDVYPHSDVFTGQVVAQHVTIPAGTWVAVGFSGTQQVTPAPTITNLAVTPSTVSAGQPVTISATVTDTTSVTVNGAAEMLPFVDTPAQSTTYVVVATGPGGTATASTSVTVTPATVDPLQAQLDAANATIVQLTADKATLTAHLQKLGADVDAIVADSAVAKADE
jgi:hypothetical protein